MRRWACTITVVTFGVLICMAQSAQALSFTEAPGSPYATTTPPFVPNSRPGLGSAVAGDFNDDGITDLAVVDTGENGSLKQESVTILLGRHSGSFVRPPGSPIALYPGATGSEDVGWGPIAAGDFTNNGHLDLAVISNTQNKISILRGDGTGDFTPLGSPIPFEAEGDEDSLVVGDFNGDGNQDLAFASGGRVHVLLGDGAGGFTQAPGSPFSIPGEVLALASGDFNGDDLTDLAATSTDGEVYVYLASAGGRFRAASGSPIPTGERPVSILAADLTDNGDLDLAIANQWSDTVTVLLGNGQGGFFPAADSPFEMPEASEPVSIVAGEFSGTGDVDLATTASAEQVAILEGDGHGSFTDAPGSLLLANGNPNPLVVGDFNGDGRPDLVAVNSYMGVVTLLENTTPWPVAPKHEEPKSEQPRQESPESTMLEPNDLDQLYERLVGALGRVHYTRRGRRNRASLEVLASAPTPGALTVQCFGSSTPAPGRDAHSPRLIATGTVRFTSAGTRALMLRLNRNGQSLLSRDVAVRVTIRETFTPSSGVSVHLERSGRLSRYPVMTE